MNKKIFMLLALIFVNFLYATPKLNKKNYENFFKLPPPACITNLPTASLYKNGYMQGSISSLSLKFREFNISGGKKYLTSSIHYSREKYKKGNKEDTYFNFFEESAGIILLRNYGTFYKKSLNIGALFWLGNDDNENIKPGENILFIPTGIFGGASPFITYTVAIPQYYSYITAGTALHRIYFGFSTYPFFRDLKNDVRLNVKIVKFTHSIFANRRGETFFVNPEISFALTSFFSIGASYSNNDKFKISFKLEKIFY